MEELDLRDAQGRTKRVCPHCGSTHTIRNGSIASRKKKHLCKNCGRQFAENPSKIVIPEYTKQLVEKLLLERISLHGIIRVTGVSWGWLQDYVNRLLALTPRSIKVSPKPKGRLTIECDELWSFVGIKENEFYVWLAIDRNTREIFRCFIGDRTRKSARQLWNSWPGIHR